MGPRRIRRQPHAEDRPSPWDAEATLRLLDGLGVKRMHSGPLLRALAVRVVNAPLESQSCTKSWNSLGLSEQELVSSGLPRRSAALLEVTVPLSTRVAEARTSADGSTTKMVIELHDSHRVEAVVMRHGQRTTVCVSSQVGCQMGCTFCATGTMPVVGDLGAGEIVEQLLHAQQLEAAAGRPPVRNAVFMGMGEPLNNYGAVLAAVHTMTDLNQLGKYALPPSKVTVSTVGVASRMRQLAIDMPTVSLAFSLHAPNQELREKIVPTARHNPLPELLEALDLHTSSCRRPTPTSAAAMVEYVLLAGVNDNDSCATELGTLMAPRARNVMVNLIPYNPGASSAPGGFCSPSHEVVERFQQIVAAFGVTTRVRREMGRDIAGACGQLALSKVGPSGEGTEPPSDNVHDQDVEDFVAWRQKQPKDKKAAVHADCVAVAAAVGAKATSKNSIKDEARIQPSCPSWFRPSVSPADPISTIVGAGMVCAIALGAAIFAAGWVRRKHLPMSLCQ